MEYERECEGVGHPDQLCMQPAQVIALDKALCKAIIDTTPEFAYESRQVLDAIYQV